MVASIQNHFHILDSASPGDATTTGEWSGVADQGNKPQDLPEFQVFVAPRRALDATFHPHRLLDDSGDPVLIQNWQLVVWCTDWADVLTWRDMLGKIKYFIYHYHDPAAHNSYTQRVMIDQLGIPRPRGPLYEWIELPVHLTDASQEES